ncbi:MAG: hypothetical protein HQ546_07855, partial [Planctomycetes bacterium]|nr:hypothetical protein [Planctomycetota bacterium]
NLEWFRRQFAAGEGGKAATWKAMEELARRAKSSAGPIFIPHLAGRVSPPQPALRGAWVGLTHAHTRGDLYRAVLEGVALEYTIYRDTLLEYNRGLHFRELRVTGGGQQSALWNQIKADALGMPVRRIVNSIGAPMGAAMLAAWGVGILSGLTQAAKAWIRPGHAKRPRPSMSDYYRKRSCLYRSLIERLDIELK